MNVNFTQINDFDKTKELVVDGKILVRTFGAMVLHVRVASSAKYVIVCAGFQSTIEMRFAPLVIRNISTLWKTRIQFSLSLLLNDIAKFTRIKYEVHGGSLHCFRYDVKTVETFGRISHQEFNVKYPLNALHSRPLVCHNKN